METGSIWKERTEMKTSFFAAVLAAGAAMLLGAAEPDPPPLPRVEAWRKNTGTGAEQVFKGVLNDASIQFGNKTLMLSKDGNIQCTTGEYGTLLTMKRMITDGGRKISMRKIRNFIGMAAATAFSCSE